MQTPASRFRASPDYRSVRLDGGEFSLTTNQARIIEILYQLYEKGTPDISSAYVLETLEIRTSRLQDTFRSNKAAWKALIKKGKTRGTIRLNN